MVVLAVDPREVHEHCEQIVARPGRFPTEMGLVGATRGEVRRRAGRPVVAGRVLGQHRGRNLAEHDAAGLIQDPQTRRLR